MVPIAIGRIMSYKNTSFLVEIKIQFKKRNIKEIFQYYFQVFYCLSKLKVVLLQFEKSGITFRAIIFIIN